MPQLQQSTNVVPDSRVKQHTQIDIMAKRFNRVMFPSPTNKGLPGLFSGYDATEYLEQFSRAYKIYGGDEEDKILYFE